jgi:uncharacterized membrane protein
MFYWIKIIHVISATLLFGVGVATAIYYVYLNQQTDIQDIIKVNKQVGYADWIFTAMAGVIQPITGFTLIYLKHYTLSAEWWLVVMFGFGLAGLCWFPAVYLRNKCLQLAEVSLMQNNSLPINYYQYYRWRCALSVIAFFILIIVFYFMANVPQPT